MDRTPGYITRATRKKDREKSSDKTHLFNIWTIGAMDRTSGQPKVKMSEIFSPFMRMHLTRDPSTWALTSGCPPPFSLILLYVSQHRSLTSISQKKTSSNSFTRDSSNRDREKSSDLTRLFNIWTIGAMNRTLGQSQVKLSLLGSISLKNRPHAVVERPESKLVIYACIMWKNQKTRLWWTYIWVYTYPPPRKDTGLMCCGAVVVLFNGECL
jgi:hypothetical protein